VGETKVAQSVKLESHDFGTVSALPIADSVYQAFGVNGVTIYLLQLSFAMAMLGNPRVVFLDEPSTGLDPQSKRVFWDAIKHSFSGSDRGAILTTHYMEEADALCNRIGIMINGQLE